MVVPLGDRHIKPNQPIGENTMPSMIRTQCAYCRKTKQPNGTTNMKKDSMLIHQDYLMVYVLHVKILS